MAIALFQSPLGWRYSFGVMVFPALFAVFLRRFIPESQIWIQFQQAKQAGTLSPTLTKETEQAPMKVALTGQQRWLTYRLIILFTLMESWILFILNSLHQFFLKLVMTKVA